MSLEAIDSYSFSLFCCFIYWLCLTFWTNEFLGSYSNYKFIISFSIFNRMGLWRTLCLQSFIEEVHNSWSNVGLHVEGHRRWNRAKTHSRTLHHHFSFPYPLQILKTKRYTLLFPINRYSKKGMLNGDRKGKRWFMCLIELKSDTKDVESCVMWSKAWC